MTNLKKIWWVALSCLILGICRVGTVRAEPILRVDEKVLRSEDLDKNHDKVVAVAEAIEGIETAVYQKVIDDWHLEPTDKDIADDRAVIRNVISTDTGFRSLAGRKSSQARIIQAANSVFSGDLAPADAYKQQISEVTKELRSFILMYEACRTWQVQNVLRQVPEKDVVFLTSDEVLKACRLGDTGLLPKNHTT